MATRSTSQDDGDEDQDDADKDDSDEASSWRAKLIDLGISQVGNKS